MRTPIVIILLLTLSIFSCIGKVVVKKQSEFIITTVKYSFIQEYESPNGNHLNLGTVGGNIKVKGYEGNRVKVAFVVTKNNGQVIEMTLEELQEYANFIITKEGSNLTIQVKEIFRKNMSVGFIVEAPVNTICSISASGGNLSISNLNGNQDMRTSGGNILMEKVKGDLNAHTSGGNISMENLDGTTKVSTSGGNISLENISGSVSASTSGGNVRADFKALTQKLELETNGGSISCELPSGVGMNLDLSAIEIKTSLNKFQGSTKSNHISGQINGGGLPVKMSCPGGTINLKFSNSSDNQ